MAGFLLSDAELHGLIDGQIEVHHRADILRRAAASTIDRERIGSWQSQCELIRAAFQSVDREPLPSALDLRAPARLHAVPPSRTSAFLDDAPPIVAAGRSRNRLILPSLAALIAAAGLVATWLAGGFSLAYPDAASPDEVLARRTSGENPAVPIDGMAIQTPSAMPTATIPDLTTLGFTLTEAEVQTGEPSSMLFHYRNAGFQQITLGVSRSDQTLPPADASRPVSVGKSLVWHVGTRAYALAGDLQRDQLRALVPVVRDLALDE